MRDLVFSSDGKYIAAGSFGGYLHVWDAATGSTVRQWSGWEADGSVYALAFSPNSIYLASGESDGFVRVWNIDSGEPLWALRGHDDGVACATFSGEDGYYLAMTSIKGEVKVWETQSGRMVRTLSNADPDARWRSKHITAFTPDQKTVVSVNIRDGAVRRWQATGKAYT